MKRLFLSYFPVLLVSLLKQIKQIPPYTPPSTSSPSHIPRVLHSIQTRRISNYAHWTISYHNPLFPHSSFTPPFITLFLSLPLSISSLQTPKSNPEEKRNKQKTTHKSPLLNSTKIPTLMRHIPSDKRSLHFLESGKRGVVGSVGHGWVGWAGWVGLGGWGCWGSWGTGKVSVPPVD